MTPEGTVQQIQTSLVLGIQFDEFDFRLFLREYHRNLRNRFADESFPAYSPSVVLDSLITRYEENCQDGRAGRRFEALRRYARRAHRLDLALTGSDYGELEQRTSPYDFDRTFYHLGRELISAQVQMEFPGYNPYRSTRRLSIPFVRDHLDELLELVPDYLWWAMHDKRDGMANILAPEQLAELRRRIELAGFKLDNFGLYLTTQEYVFLPGELDDSQASTQESSHQAIPKKAAIGS
jgi:hypothetical protein